MKILQVVHDYLPDRIGGAQLQAHHLACVLSARGHQVVCLYPVAGPKGPLRERSLDGLRLLEHPRPREHEEVSVSWVEEEGAAAFAEVLAQERPEVVHFQHFALWGTRCASLAREAGCATVATLHDYHLLCARGTLLDDRGALCPSGRLETCADCLADLPFRDERWSALKRRHRLAKAMSERLQWNRAHLRSVQRVFVPSYHLADAMAAADMVREEQVTLLKAGCTGPIREPRAPSLDGPLRVGYVGALVPTKGVHVLIEAARRLVGEPVELHLHGPLASYPDYVGDLRSAAEGHPVRFHGRFEPACLDEVLAGIDVLVMPSLWPDDTALAIQHAWRAGLPVIATDLGGMAEAVTHQVNGLLFPRGDARALAEAIRSLVRDPAFAARLARGRPGVPTIEAVAERMEETYDRCLRSLVR